MRTRKTLPHQPPYGIDPSREIWFITVNCEPRRHNHLANTTIWPHVVESIEQRIARGIWWVHLFLAMPDHCHALISFPPDGIVKQTIADWKRWLATQHHIRWQTDYFDHRLRHDENFDEKSSYILQNPIRAQLAREPRDWPYQWHPPDAPPFTTLPR